MSDDNTSTPPGALPEQPFAPAPIPPASAYSEAPGAPAPYAQNGGAGLAPAKKGLSVTSFVLGIVGVVFFWTAWLASLLGLVAVILGFVSRSREPGAPRWMRLWGIILGFVAIVLGLIALVVGLIAIAYVRTHPTLTQ